MNIQATMHGELYDANYDPQLIAKRTACHDLCHEYNSLRPSHTAQRESILRRLLGKGGRALHH